MGPSAPPARAAADGRGRSARPLVVLLQVPVSSRGRAGLRGASLSGWDLYSQSPWRASGARSWPKSLAQLGHLGGSWPEPETNRSPCPSLSLEQRVLLTRGRGGRSGEAQPPEALAEGLSVADADVLCQPCHPLLAPSCVSLTSLCVCGGSIPKDSSCALAERGLGTWLPPALTLPFVPLRVGNRGSGLSFSQRDPREPHATPAPCVTLTGHLSQPKRGGPILRMVLGRGLAAAGTEVAC